VSRRSDEACMNDELVSVYLRVERILNENENLDLAPRDSRDCNRRVAENGRRSNAPAGRVASAVASGPKGESASLC
jgi:hypothetical protein